MRTSIPKELDFISREVAKELNIPIEIVIAVVSHNYKYVNTGMGTADFGDFETYKTLYIPFLGTFYTEPWRVKKIVRQRDAMIRKYRNGLREDRIRKNEEFLRND